MEPNISFSEASPVNEPLTAAERLAEELLRTHSGELPTVPRALRRNVLGAATRAEAARQAWKWRVLGLAAGGALLCGTFVRIAVLEARRLQRSDTQFNRSVPAQNSFPQPSFPVLPDPAPPPPLGAPDLASPPVNGPIPDSAAPGEASGDLVDQPASETAPAKPQPPATPDPAKSEAVPDEVPRPVDPRQGPILGQFDTDTAPLEEAFRQRREKLALLTQLTSAQ